MALLLSEHKGGVMLYKLVRPRVFNFYRDDPETAHEDALSLLEWIGHNPGLLKITEFMYRVQNPKLEQTLMGLKFPNPVGLAAGFSKNGEGARGLVALGFGFLEIGKVTPPPQGGNPRQRMFRLTQDEALINRMGFNNYGAKRVAKKVESLGKLFVPIGMSLGKAKDTPLEKAAEDYLACLVECYHVGDYFVINVSSPNTKNLRQLQDKPLLKEILQAVIARAKDISWVFYGKTKRKPILVKIAPDLETGAIVDVLDLCQELGLDGIIATNTTWSRQGLSFDPKEEGGMSGAPLFNRALEVVKIIRKYNSSIPLIAVGGISGDHQALQMMDAGANLVQLFTGLVYEGPEVVKNILHGILRHLRKMKLDNVTQIPAANLLAQKATNE